MNFPTDVSQIPAFLFEFFVVGILIKYVFAKWLAEKVLKGIKFVLVRSQRHAIYWLHYREKAMGHGHQYETPELCQDGVCRMLPGKSQQDSVTANTKSS